METWAASFFKLYEGRLKTLSTLEVLEAFWYWCNRFKKDSYRKEYRRILKLK